MTLNIWFVIAFIVLWILGPLTQLLQLVAPLLHKKLGLMEAKAYEPQFEWFRLEERAIAFADMTFLSSGVVFIIGALLGRTWAIPFGFFTCAIYVYFGVMCLSRWALLGRHNLSPLSPGQLKLYVLYIGVFIVFGFFGMIYLWGSV